MRDLVESMELASTLPDVDVLPEEYVRLLGYPRGWIWRVGRGSGTRRTAAPGYTRGRQKTLMSAAIQFALME